MAEAVPESPEEAQPLLQGVASAYGSSPRRDDVLRQRLEARQKLQNQCGTYSPEDISGWQALMNTTGTVWKRRSLWKVAAQMFGLSTMVGLLVVIFVTDATQIQVGKFNKLSTFLNVFVGLLIGLFISLSMSRWYDCAGGVVDLCTAIRDLQRDLYTLKVPDEMIDKVIRYSVLSGWLLDMDLQIEHLSNDQKPGALKERWDVLATSDDENTSFWITAEEKEALECCDDPATVILIWVGALLGRMSEAGHIPPKASPTFCSLMAKVQGAHNGIRRVKMSINVQPPYLYVQMLAVLVHTNNMLNAVSFGLTWGASMGTTLIKIGYAVHSIDKSVHASWKLVVHDAQNVLLSFFMSCAGPFIYQALLEVGVAIAQPYSSPEGNVPFHWLLHVLEKDLTDGKTFAKRLPP
mmetsp:Transcript_114807/g.245083  ORF Transcript_114807/g.245083 Transcript_114807/m.245083 type:complete len:407 (+) Transcript_114807:118-1338(+)